MRKVAVIEDDPDLSFLIKLNLEREGFEVKTFSRATDFFHSALKDNFSLVLVDIMLPDFDGYRIAKFLKSRPDLKDIPLIFITAKGGEEDKLKGFELGADDYITKPFSLKELIARIKAVLRRYEGRITSKVYEFKELKVFPEEKRVFLRGEELHLTPAEFKILLKLVENYGKPVSRESLLDEIQEFGRESTERTIDVHIKHIRDKLRDYKHLIKTVRGFGYKFEE